MSRRGAPLRERPWRRQPLRRVARRPSPEPPSSGRGASWGRVRPSAPTASSLSWQCVERGEGARDLRSRGARWNPRTSNRQFSWNNSQWPLAGAARTTLNRRWAGIGAARLRRLVDCVKPAAEVNARADLARAGVACYLIMVNLTQTRPRRALASACKDQNPKALAHPQHSNGNSNMALGDRRSENATAGSALGCARGRHPRLGLAVRCGGLAL